MKRYIKREGNRIYVHGVCCGCGFEAVAKVTALKTDPESIARRMVEEPDSADIFCPMCRARDFRLPR